MLTLPRTAGLVLETTGRRRRLVEVPPRPGPAAGGGLERLPGKLLTRDQLLMLQRDNVVAPGVPGLAELGIVPTPVALVVPAYCGGSGPAAAGGDPQPT